MGWQDFVALAVVAAAAVFVVMRAWGALMGRGDVGCASGCGSCALEGVKVKAGELLEIGGASRIRE